MYLSHTTHVTHYTSPIQPVQKLPKCAFAHAILAKLVVQHAVWQWGERCVWEPERCSSSLPLQKTLFTQLVERCVTCDV